MQSLNDLHDLIEKASSLRQIGCLTLLCPTAVLKAKSESRSKPRANAARKDDADNANDCGRVDVADATTTSSGNAFTLRRVPSTGRRSFGHVPERRHGVEVVRAGDRLEARDRKRSIVNRRLAMSFQVANEPTGRDSRIAARVFERNQDG
jgi:hypothetical protein